MQNLTSVEEFQQLSKSKKVIFYFKTDWCGDCIFIKPKMPEILKAHPEIQFVKVDRDEFIDLCEELSIVGIPSFLAYENGEETGRFVSKNRKTKEEIEAFIQTLIR
ncbi:thioredoxin family protein [Carnobacterium funditum]|uniref:thioredoxin family protein n=1 Tax=Carnobacterium funditum TaxID=2752 RepID=UPI000550C0ED|nr:thioredoxin family protein [Carnobacterium funditum]